MSTVTVISQEMSVPCGTLMTSATGHSDERNRPMAKYKIESKGNPEWDVEADGYTLGEGFFHFHSDGQQVFAVQADVVRTVRAESADQK
jgi:hypothetical protein